jgi:hypothetical protein
MVFKPGGELARFLGSALPDEAQPPRQFQGAPRIIVPVVRTGLVAGEPLTLTVMVLGARPARAALFWRKLAEPSSAYASIPLDHWARGVWTVTLPTGATSADVEYYVEVATESGQILRFPATAPHLNQTVVAVEAK